MPRIFGSSVRVGWEAPKRIHTNLVCDLDTRYVDATGSICTRVFDQVSGTHAFQQATISLMPTLEKHGWSPGVDSCLLDGKKTRLFNSTSLAKTVFGGLDQDSTVYFVGQIFQTTGTNQAVVPWSVGNLASSASTANPLYYPVFNSTGHMSGVKRDDVALTATTSGTSIALDYYTDRKLWSYVQTGRSLEIDVNGILHQTMSQDVGAGTYSVVSLGGRHTAGTTNGFDNQCPWRFSRQLFFSDNKQGTVEHTVLQSALMSMYGLNVKIPNADPVYSGPPIGAIRWDAWSNEPDLNWYPADLSRLIPTGSKFHWRQPIPWDNFQQWNTASFVDTQAIVDAELTYAKGALDYWLYDWYPPADVVSIPSIPQSNVMNAFIAHYSSSLKSNVNFAFLLPYEWITYPFPSGTYYQQFCNWIADKVKDPNYQRIGGKPLIALYNDGTVGNRWQDRFDLWGQLTGTIGEHCYALSVNDVTMLQNLGLQANMKYGPNGSDLVGAGRHGYSEQITKDAGGDGAVPGAQQISNRTAVNDRRAITAQGQEETTFYVDLPTQPQWNSTMITAVQPTQHLVIIYAWSEVGEGGAGIVPTYQEGTRFLDGIRWARGQRRPDSYHYEISAAYLYCTRSIGWSVVTPNPAGISGSHDGDVVLSSTSGSFLMFNHTNLQSCEVIASVGPLSGTLQIDIDGLFAATASCFATVPSVRVPVWSGSFSQGFHSITASIYAGTCSVDTFRVCYKP